MPISEINGDEEWRDEERDTKRERKEVRDSEVARWLHAENLGSQLWREKDESRGKGSTRDFHNLILLNFISVVAHAMRVFMSHPLLPISNVSLCNLLALRLGG